MLQAKYDLRGCLDEGCFTEAQSNRAVAFCRYQQKKESSWEVAVRAREAGRGAVEHSQQPGLSLGLPVSKILRRWQEGSRPN